jgi:hypothetical protein
MADKKTEEQELKDIFDDKRYFINDGPGGDGKKYFIDNADVDEVRNADWHYSKTYNEALLAGVTTAAQMADILEARDITGKPYEEKRQQLIKDLDESVEKLTTTKDLDEKRALTTRVEDLRNQLFRHNQRAASPMSNTCEQLAEDARVEYLTSAMIKDESGVRVWTSYADYKTTKKPQLAMRSRYEIMLALQGLDSDFLSKTPEALAREEIKQLEAGDSKEDETAKGSKVDEATKPATKKDSKKPAKQ